MHDVVHVSLLKEFRSDGTVIPHLPPHLVAGILQYEVVKWLGYGHESITWELEKNLERSAELIQEYWEAAKPIDEHEAGASCQDSEARQVDPAQGSVIQVPQEIRLIYRKGQLPSRYRF